MSSSSKESVRISSEEESSEPATDSTPVKMSLKNHPRHLLLQRQMTVAEAKRNKRWMISGACLIITGVFFFILGLLIQFVLYPVILEKIIYQASSTFWRNKLIAAQTNSGKDPTAV